MESSSMPLHSQPYVPNGPDDWEPYKATIAELYPVKTLTEVMKEMKEKYKFKATENQYKKQLHKWGLNHKRINGDEYMCMDRIEKKRKQDDGKETEFILRGKEVDKKDINRYRKRNKISEENVASNTVATPPDLSYSTPRNAPRTTDGTAESFYVNLSKNYGPPCRRDSFYPIPGGRILPTSNPDNNIQQGSRSSSPSDSIYSWMKDRLREHGISPKDYWIPPTSFDREKYIQQSPIPSSPPLAPFDWISTFLTFFRSGTMDPNLQGSSLHNILLSTIDVPGNYQDQSGYIRVIKTLNFTFDCYDCRILQSICRLPKDAKGYKILEQLAGAIIVHEAPRLDHTLRVVAIDVVEAFIRAKRLGQAEMILKSNMDQNKGAIFGVTDRCESHRLEKKNFEVETVPRLSTPEQLLFGLKNCLMAAHVTTTQHKVGLCELLGCIECRNIEKEDMEEESMEEEDMEEEEMEVEEIGNLAQVNSHQQEGVYTAYGGNSSYPFIINMEVEGHNNSQAWNDPNNYAYYQMPQPGPAFQGFNLPAGYTPITLTSSQLPMYTTTLPPIYAGDPDFQQYPLPFSFPLPTIEDAEVDMTMELPYDPQNPT
ncbi:MAG: hypothetical protein M1834_001945 [Cirrosporium novae-zelandiae]|nr:MAG: hypothetical protein M1834_001945 [Cirrosporium novae-zelandiae]